MPIAGASEHPSTEQQAECLPPLQDVFVQLSILFGTFRFAFCVCVNESLGAGAGRQQPSTAGRSLWVPDYPRSLPRGKRDSEGIESLNCDLCHRNTEVSRDSSGNPNLQKGHARCAGDPSLGAG